MVSVVTFSLTPQDVLRGVLHQIGLIPLQKDWKSGLRRERYKFFTIFFSRNFLTSPDDAPEFRTENLWKNFTFPGAALTSSLFGIYHSGCLSLLLFLIAHVALTKCDTVIRKWLIVANGLHGNDSSVGCIKYAQAITAEVAVFCENDSASCAQQRVTPCTSCQI